MGAQWIPGPSGTVSSRAVVEPGEHRVRAACTKSHILPGLVLPAYRAHSHGSEPRGHRETDRLMQACPFEGWHKPVCSGCQKSLEVE